MEPTRVVNGPCADCGRPHEFIGEAFPHGTYVFCCAAAVARHQARMAASPAGVIYSAEVPA